MLYNIYMNKSQQPDELPLLGEITEKDLGMPPVENPDELVYTPRRAVRAVMFNHEGKIAILNATNDGYHKLPGGGIEIVSGNMMENEMIALERELMEETGRTAKVLDGVGKILESKDKAGMLQVSDCYIAQVTGKEAETSMTQDEIAAGMKVEWMTIDDAITQLQNDTPEGYLGKFILARDLLFLKKAREILVTRQEVRSKLQRILMTRSLKPTTTPALNA